MYVELSALTHNGPIPRPHPPCELPTPDEQFRQYTEKKQRVLDERENEQHQKEAQRRSEKGEGASGHSVGDFFSSAASKLRSASKQALLEVKRVGTEVSTLTESQVRQVGRQIGKERFSSDFHDLSAMGEILLAVYSCSAMHAGQKFGGHMYVTRNYLCFSAQISSTLVQATSAVRDALFANNPTGPEGIRQVIPLTEVASIQLSVALDTIDQGPPFFLFLPAPNVLATSLQIYTTKQQLFQFLAFESMTSSAGEVLTDSLKGRSIDRAYNYLDHAWRASTTVPLQGVNYAS